MNNAFPIRTIHCIYNMLVILCSPFLFVYYLLRSHVDGKYQFNYPYRLGLKLPSSLPPCRRIWFHALSVGETISVIPLIRALKRLSPETEIVFSTKTETGHAVACDRLAQWVSSFFYLPIDFPLIMDYFIERLKPSVFVLVETETWPNLLRSLKARRICTVLVNGRISQRSFQRFKRFGHIVQPIFGCFDAVFAQSLEDKQRYESLGVPEDHVTAIGNLKSDSALEKVTETTVDRIRQDTGIGAERAVWIAGSTHEGEEKILLAVHKSLRKEYPELLLVLAPRNVRRASEIASLCSARGLSTVTRSGKDKAKEKEVYLLDTMGELSTFYALADIAFIGGSLVPFGGHNPLEAVAMLKPTLWGPHLSNFREIEKSLLDAACGSRVASERELEEILKQWLADPMLRLSMKENARRFLGSQGGSSERIAHFLVNVSSNPLDSLSPNTDKAEGGRSSE